MRKDGAAAQVGRPAHAVPGRAVHNITTAVP